MTTFINAINLVEGGPTVHVTVYDQAGNALAPGNISWDSHSELTITADPTGFNFQALSRSTAVSFAANATLTSQNPNVTTPLTINIGLPAVTELQFSAP